MLGDKPLNLLKELAESFGPSGFERDPVRISRSYVEKYADEIVSDRLGSIMFVKKGSAEKPRILVAGHVDEIGFVITGVDEKTGFLTFAPLGGWFDQVLLGHTVQIRTRKGDLLGVIAAKPPHLLPPDERDKVVKMDSMYIDIGASSGKEAEEMNVRIGDPVAPRSPFTLIRNGRVAICKAFDDRVGAFVALEAFRRIAEGLQHPNTLIGATTVQEEVGLRGAATVAHTTEPDVAIALEVDISGDVPGIKKQEAPTALGKGPSMLTFDSSMIPNQAFKEFVINVAEKEKIPLQLSVVTRGGTDAGRFHIARSGCPSIVIGVPTRHIHSHCAMLNLEDVEKTIRLTVSLIKELDQQTVTSFTQI